MTALMAGGGGGGGGGAAAAMANIFSECKLVRLPVSRVVRSLKEIALRRVSGGGGGAADEGAGGIVGDASDSPAEAARENTDTLPASIPPAASHAALHVRRGDMAYLCDTSVEALQDFVKCAVKAGGRRRR